MNVDYCKSLEELLKKNEAIERPFRVPARVEINGSEKEGTELPLLKDNSERFRRLRELTAIQCLEGIKYNFGRKFGFSKEQVGEEVKEIKAFKKQADAFSPKEAFERLAGNKNTAFVEYQRVKLGYYDRNFLDDDECDCSFGGQLCAVYTRVYLWLPFLQGLLNENDGGVRQEPEIRELRDIWKGSEREYDGLISFLKKNCKDNADQPFITEENGKYVWTNYPPKGRVQLLAALVYCCIEKNLIEDKHSARVLRTVLQRTFNGKFNEKPFKSLKANPPDEKYCLPFRHLLQTWDKVKP